MKIFKHHSAFFQLKFPSSCLLCDNRGLSGKDICHYCLQQLLKNTLCCYQCGETLNQISKLCGRCLKESPAFEQTHAPFLYLGAMAYLISTLKFNQKYKNARLLGNLLAEYLQQHAEMPECIIPIPLHKSRYRQRGFNQSLEIAKRVSHHLKIPLITDRCIRHRNTLHQIGLKNQQRRENINHAFSMAKPIDYQHVAVLDDVMTTGATANEMAKLLKTAGVKRVDIWVCARA